MFGAVTPETTNCVHAAGVLTTFRRLEFALVDVSAKLFARVDELCEASIRILTVRTVHNALLQHVLDLEGARVASATVLKSIVAFAL